MNKKKLLLTSNIPSPYMMSYLKELSREFDVTAVFERKLAKDRNKNWYSKDNLNLHVIYLKSLPVGNENGFSLGILKILKHEPFDILVVGNPTTPTGIIELLYCKKHKIKHVIQSEGGFQGSGKGLKERFKKILMENADMYLTGMWRDNDYFLRYGAKKEQLKFFHFSSQMDKDLKNAKSQYQNCDKKRLKEELNVKESKIILTVGRFSYKKGYGKGYDILMHIAEHLKNEDIGFYIVGDEPTKEFVKWKQQKELEHVHFVGFLNMQDLSKYYLIADTFILLTRNDTWGLVINEAMSFSLPVISSIYSVAAIELIENEENGYLVTLDDIDNIIDKILKVLYNDKLNNRIRKNNLKKIENYSIEQMANDVIASLSLSGK